MSNMDSDIEEMYLERGPLVEMTDEEIQIHATTLEEAQVADVVRQIDGIAKRKALEWYGESTIKSCFRALTSIYFEKGERR
jgi:hypothetical protein